MNRMAKFAWSGITSVALVVLFSFFAIVPARAPSGGKLWTGGRTIASLQEEDFDRRLMKYQLCYGVKLVADQCTLERRRVCKAMLVHEMETALATSNRFLKAPVEFRCEDTALSHSVTADDLVGLRPNGETKAIQSTLEPALQQDATVSSLQHEEARGACEFLTDCKWAMRPRSFSFRKLASCLTTPNATHRKVLLNEVGAMVFGGRGARSRTLYSNLVDPSGR